MKDFEEIRQLWQIQPSKPANVEDIFKRINDQKHGYVNKLLLQIIAVAIALLFVFTVWLTATFSTWTSHLAMIIVICNLIYYFRIQITDFNKINKTAFLFKKPDEYLKYLKDYKKSRFKLNTTKYRIYVALISIALILFSIEMFYILSLGWLILYVVLSIGWLFLCQFVFMKYYNKREEQKLEEIIQTLERLSQQFV